MPIWLVTNDCIKYSLLLVISEPAIIDKLANWFKFCRFLSDLILLEIWKLAKWPISCANTPTIASYEGAYLNKPVEINSLLLLSI